MGQIAMWPNPVYLAGFYEGGQDVPVLCLGFVTCKKTVLATDGDGTIVRSTVLLSISMRPSVRNRTSSSQYFAVSLSSSPVGDMAETYALALSSKVLKPATITADLSSRVASISDAGQLRICVPTR